MYVFSYLFYDIGDLMNSHLYQNVIHIFFI